MVDSKPLNVDLPLNRERLNLIIAPLLSRSLHVLENAVDSARERHGYDWEDIDGLLLVGGPTRIPRIRELLAETLHQHAPLKDIEIKSSLNPDEIVAYGAAIMANRIAESTLELSEVELPTLELEKVPLYWRKDWMEGQSILRSIDPFKGQILKKAMVDFANSVRSGNEAEIGVNGPILQDTIIESRSEIPQSLELAKLDVKPGSSLAERHIFLSYSRKDFEMLRRIRDDLRSNEFEVWTDEKLEPGTPSWEKSISTAIREALCVAVILSPDSEKSEWVGRELALAETLGIRIFPILVRGDDTNAIPFRLISHQWIDARHNYDSALQNLITILKKHMQTMKN